MVALVSRCHNFDPGLDRSAPLSKPDSIRADARARLRAGPPQRRDHIRLIFSRNLTSYLCLPRRSLGEGGTLTSVTAAAGRCGYKALAPSNLPDNAASLLRRRPNRR